MKNVTLMPWRLSITSFVLLALKYIMSEWSSDLRNYLSIVFGRYGREQHASYGASNERGGVRASYDGTGRIDQESKWCPARLLSLRVLPKVRLTGNTKSKQSRLFTAEFGTKNRKKIFITFVITAASHLTIWSQYNCNRRILWCNFIYLYMWIFTSERGHVYVNAWN